MAWIRPGTKPSRAFQTVCEYCSTPRAGSSACAPCHDPISREPSSTQGVARRAKRISRPELHAHENRATDEVVVVDVVTAKMGRPGRQLVRKVRAAHREFEAAEPVVVAEPFADADFERTVEVPEVAELLRGHVIAVVTDVAACERHTEHIVRVWFPSDTHVRLGSGREDSIADGVRESLDVGSTRRAYALEPRH